MNRLQKFEELNTVPGFLFNGFHVGLKEDEEPDLAIVYSELPATAAALFTRNVVKAEPVKVGMENIKSGKVQLVIINSKNANACTGEEGKEAVLREIELGSELFNVKPEQVFVSSTGVIGRRFPIEKLEAGLKETKGKLESSAAASNKTARAILTTDTCVKGVSDTFEIGGKIVHMSAFGKGSGMIHPNMGTMLAYVLCDIDISQPLLKKALRLAVDASYNMISVDGDTSTNDSILIMCNGLAGNKTVSEEGEHFQIFTDKLTQLCKGLAKQIVADGEGICRRVTYKVKGCATETGAREIVRTISSSLLVKTAVFGKDPNWGRLLAAAGRAGVDFDPNKVNLYLGANRNFRLLYKGQPDFEDYDKLEPIMGKDDIVFEMEFSEGQAEAEGWGTDLSYEYVKINAEYTT